MVPLPAPIPGVGVWGCPGSPPALAGGTPPGPLFLAAPSLAPCRSSPWGDPSSVQEGIRSPPPLGSSREGFPVPPVPLQEAPDPKTLAAPTVSLEVGGTPQNLGDETREGDRGANPVLPQIPGEVGAALPQLHQDPRDLCPGCVHGTGLQQQVLSRQVARPQGHSSRRVCPLPRRGSVLQAWLCELGALLRCPGSAGASEGAAGSRCGCLEISRGKRELQQLRAQL